MYIAFGTHVIVNMSFHSFGGGDSFSLKSFILSRKGKELYFHLFFNKILMTSSVYRHWSPGGPTEVVIDGTRSTDAPELMASFRPLTLCPTVWGEALRKPSG